MSYSAELVEKWLEENKKSASELASLLNVNRSLISRIRSNKGHLTNEQALFLGESLEIEDVKILAGLMAEKAKSDKEKAAWVKLASQGTAAVFAALGIIPNFAYWGVMSEEVNARP